MITDVEISELNERGYVSVLRKSTVLTDAQIKALPTSPVEVIASPGANKIVLPLFIVARIDWHADYTNIDAASVQAQFSTDTMNELANENGDLGLFLAGGGPDGIWSIFAPRQTLSAGVMRALAGSYDSDIGNKPVNLAIFNGSAGNFTGGDAANSMKITAVYVLLDY